MEMVLGYFLVLTGLAGSGLAGYFDLKTTEIPDEIPLAMVVLGVLTRFGYSLFTGDWSFFLLPAIIGGGFFGFGFLMYYSGQWGGGDAKILGAIGILMGTLPQGIAASSVFPLFMNLIVNVFLVGAAYIIIYGIIMAARDTRIKDHFLKSLKGSVNEFIIFFVLILAVVGVNTYVFWANFGVLNLWLIGGTAAGVTGFYLLWKFLKSVERVGFNKKISTKNLREGDMLGEDIKKLKLSKKLIRGLTKEEISKIRKHKKTIWIREGVRFAPVFPIAVLTTIFFGNLIVLII